MAENLRGPLVATVRRDLAAARAAVRSALAAATSAHAEATAQREAVAGRTPQRHESLAAERDAALAAAAVRLHRETSTVAEALTALAEAAAPGAAGLTWPAWQPSPSPSPAGLLRIGAMEHEPPLPALVPFLDAAHLGLSGPDSSILDGVISGLLLRALGGAPVGGVRLWVYDPGRLGGALAGFAPLAPPDIVRYIGPGGLTETLDELAGHIERITESVLAGEHHSLADAAIALGRRPEPWRILVLLADDPAELSPAQRARLDWITRTGIAAGVHVIARGVDLEPHETVATVAVVAGSSAATSLTGELTVVLDPAPPTELVTRYAREQAAGPPPATLDSLLPETFWTRSSARELRAPIGAGTRGEPVELVLGDDLPHALIGGPPGSGRTNLLYCWLAGLAGRYSPDELELHLLDFQEGLSFARFAHDSSWLPQVRLIGMNIAADPEFGVAVLRHLAEELLRRAAAAKKAGAARLAELRAQDPEGRWPRIVAVIDEFEALLGPPEASALLEDLVRRGRSHGIHLVLAGQDLTGIEALASQFTLRIALPKAHGILAETNLAAELIPRYHAVVNTESGTPSANRIVRLPDAGDRTRWEALQAELFTLCGPDLEPPRLFDGEVAPAYPLLPTTPPDFAKDGAVALLGETVDVRGRPATLRLTRSPGRNLAVLGTRTAQACAILSAAGQALARQHEPGSADFYVACFDSDATVHAKTLFEELPGAHWRDASSFVDILGGLTVSTRPTYLFLYAVDAASAMLAEERGPGEPTGHDLLRTVLNHGPQRRTHTLAWWRSVAGLRDDLGGAGARLDAIGAWVALDVPGPDLAPLSAQPGGPVWHPRPQRGLFFDRALHRVPEILIPYEAEL